jgi:L-alanine-DL-glutamate epimerase-like enolase superfamily enzyme
VKLTWRTETIHSRHPFHVARAGASLDGTETTRVIVRIEHDGTEGSGEAAPSAYYGQSCESVETALSKAGPLMAEEPLVITPIMERIRAAMGDQTAALAAIDMALHDWVGRRLGVPVWRLLGLDPTSTPPTSFTIGLTDPAELPGRIAEARGFRALKLKVGTDHDEETLAAVRQHAPDVRIRVDGNGGWRPDEAARQIEALSRFDLELIEQPIAAGQLDALKTLKDASPVPIVADEDCANVVDVARLAGAVDGVNVKLAKCGGITEALTMIRLARRLGLRVMIGCMIETSLGVSAAAQLASLADYVDLDGHLLLADDPFAGLTLEEGIVRPSAAPGLGVEPI